MSMQHPRGPGGPRDAGPRGGGSHGGGPRDGGPRGGGPRTDDFPRPGHHDLSAIIVEGDARVLVEVAERLGQALARPPDRRDQLTTSQIRSVFGTVRQIEMNWPVLDEEDDRARRSGRELILLKPKLAYQARRASGRGVENLRSVLDPAIDLIGNDRRRFQNFVDFFEAILAYHKFFGGQ